MVRESRDAQQIYQYLLDEIGDAINERDFEKYRLFFELPHRLETFDATIVIKTDAELRQVFDATCQRVLASGVEDLTRSCTIATFTGDDTIKGSHETRLIDANNRVQDSYTALSTLKRFGQDWRVADSQYAERGYSLPSGIVKGHQGQGGPTDN